jgi:hypothetical protein
MTRLIEPCIVTAPECPSCGRETEWENLSFNCHHCGLYWMDPNEPGFRAGGGPACGVEKPAPYERVTLLNGRPHRYTYAPCQLAAGHTAGVEHYHPGRWVLAEEEPGA